MSDAVILMAYGSPATAEDIRPYFEDIRGGRPVSDEAVAELAERYRRIGGRSPLDEVTEAQRAALERELGIPVFVGMKHWRPRIAEAVDRALAGGATRLIGVVLAPHFSRMSVGEYRERLEAALDGRDAELVLVDSWHDDPAFVDVVAARVRGTDAWVVFTAHSLPERILADGDPYREQLLETSRLVAERAGLGERWSFAFQSASPTGEPWLGPDILDELERLHGEGVGKVLVAPVGFVSDHLEILWDLEIEARERAGELGLELERMDSLNDDPAFIAALAGVVERARVAEPAVPGRSRFMSSRTCPDWPLLMEVAPELQFMHYTVAEAKLPSDVLAELQDVSAAGRRGLRRPRPQRLLRRPHRPAGRRGAARLALVRAARVGDPRARLRRGLTRRRRGRTDTRARPPGRGRAGRASAARA